MRRIVLIALVATLVLVTIPSVKAQTGTIRIGPDIWPIMLESPADFEIWVQGAGNPTSEPNILLAMTEDCWEGLTGKIVVSWTGGSVDFMKADFAAVQVNGEKVPSSGTTNGACYTVAALKDHLSYGLSVPISKEETIYCAMKPFLSGDIVKDAQTFTATLPSTHPRMLVYALGKTEGSDIFDNKVPPTNPGFIVPELGPMLLLLAPLSAFALYTVKRRKVHLK